MSGLRLRMLRQGMRWRLNSLDATCGYTQANPIKVGGGAFGGPPRERAYLDVFEVTGLEKTVTLYVDEDSYTVPQAPVGFICASPFTLAAP